MIYLIAISLAADAVAVSVANTFFFGKSKKIWLMPIYFGGFQFAMTMFGYQFGGLIHQYISRYDEIVVFLVLSFIGCKMIIEATNNDGNNLKVLEHKTIILQAIATSIDALVIGVSFTLLEINILSACVIIGIVTYLMCLIAIILASKSKICKTNKFEIIAGIILLLLAIKNLL